MSAATWLELEDRVREVQWTTYRTRESFRRALRRRSKLWTGNSIPVHGSAEAFFRGLESADMLRLDIDE